MAARAPPPVHPQGGPDDAGHTVLLPVPDAGVSAAMHCGLAWGVKDGGSDEAWAGVRQYGVEVGGHGSPAGGRACSPPSGALAHSAWHEVVSSGGPEPGVAAPMPCPSYTPCVPQDHRFSMLNTWSQMKVHHLE